MNANPFCKDNFLTSRDWEDAMLCFFVTEAQEPKLSDWERLAQSANWKDVAYSALLLSCLVQSKPKVAHSSDALVEVCRALGGELDQGLVEYNLWLRTGWLPVSRLANRLKIELRARQLL